jgi:hypothetical protein
MRRLALFLFALCLALPAAAERKQTFGDLDVHYNAFNSSFLQPDIAAAVGLTRSKTQGVVNVAVLKAGKASTAQVSGQVKNLLGQVTALQFKQISEGEAIYYLAQFPFNEREMLNFTLNVQRGDEAPHSFSFDQEFFPDE